VNWDVFCKVVDNFGDAGVVWRLCRQLSHEHGQQVRLIIDDLATLAKLQPQVQPGSPEQVVEGVCIAPWDDTLLPQTNLQVVLETFGCNPPLAYLEALSKQPGPHSWINLEHLSAESWVGDFHGLSSPGLAAPMPRCFFFPGFGQNTGGLLREDHLLSQREAFNQSHPLASDVIQVSLFAYPNAPVQKLLEQWERARVPVCLKLPQEIPLAEQIRQITGATGAVYTCGSLEIHWIPFTHQPGYDRLLWASHFNFVRGEDSFVRAQWAGVPLLWQIYSQAQNAHWTKLEAFLDLYCQGWEPDLKERYLAWSRFWNGVSPEIPDWDQWVEDWPRLRDYAGRWAEALGAQPSLTTNLVSFARKMLK
jgi:uncharacterized repeat protein (TIGR03837 family)